MERKWYLDLWALIREPFKRGIPEIVEFGTIQRGFACLICTHFPGHILFTSLNTWMLPCILQGASILFFSESFCYCNS